MALDPRFICTSDLQGLFVDKNTGLPMAAGKIYFYSDFSRTIPKAVYQLTGSPPSGFIALPNPLTLNSVGSYEDNLSNEIVIYYLPFEQGVNGDISTTTDVQELYYISVFNSDAVPQFTRDEWPPLAANLFPGNVSGEGVRNYIPNGQFLFHNDHQIVDSTSETGLDITEIAQGGWSFKKTTGGTGAYTITFNNESNSPLGALKDFPPFSVNIVTVGSGTETVRDLVIQWPDVSRFSLSTNTLYNFLFAATSNSLSTISVNVNLIMNYGTGGSAQDTTPIGPKTIGPSGTGYQYFNQTVTIPSTSGKTITADSFIALAIRLPAATPINIRLTDFAFTLGNDTLTSFPITTNAQMLSQGIAGWMPTPNPDGSDLYLPLILTQEGLIFDTGQVGEIVASLAPSAPAGNYLAMNGGAYFFAQYAANGIPLRRLGSFLTSVFASYTPTAVFPAGSGLPLFGSGPNFINAYGVVAHTDRFLLHINAGAGVGTIPAVGTAPLTLTTSADPNFTFTLNSVPTVGEYFTFTAPVISPQSYYVWFTVNGAGSDPAPGGVGIVVPIVTGDTVATSVIKILFAINQYIFATFNLAGYFLRGFDPTGLLDTNYNTRLLAGLNGLMGAYLGSSEVDIFMDHTHNAPAGSAGQFFASAPPNTASYSAGGLGLALPPITGLVSAPNDGGGETRPYNFAVNWYIKY